MLALAWLTLRAFVGASDAPPKSTSVTTRSLAVRQNPIGECDDQAIFSTKNGLNFTLHCAQRNPNNDAYKSWLYASTYSDCLELCSRFSGDGEGCFGISWVSDGGHCWLRNSNVSTADLKPDPGVVSALVDRDQMKGFNTTCPGEGDKELAGVDGIAYTTSCGQLYQGGVQCFTGGEYDCTNPSLYFYHAESLEDCLRFCVTLHPRCRIVSWNPGLQVGFANCWPRFGNQNPRLIMPGPKQGVMHSAQIIGTPSPDDACPKDKVYYSGDELNGTRFDIHCKQLNQGLNITSLQAQNITQCMDSCVANKDGCTAIIYTSNLDNGYRNCHLQKTTNEVIGSTTITYAVIASSESNDGSSSSSPSKAWIAGPVIGGIVALAVVTYATFCWQRRKSAKASALNDYAKPPGGPGHDPTTAYSMGMFRSEMHAAGVNELPASIEHGRNQGPKSEAQELPG